MSKFFDILLILEHETIISDMRWNSSEHQDRYELQLKSYIGRSVEELLGKPIRSLDSSFTWDGTSFSYHIELLDDKVLCFLKEKFDRAVYLEMALDILNDGTQVYDKKGNIIYFDKASKNLFAMESVEKKHLMDLCNISEKDSAVLTALRSQSPVLNKFVRYYSVAGRELTTVNSARPIFCDGNLIGAVNIEEDAKLIQQRANRTREVQEAMSNRMIIEQDQRNPDHYTLADLIGNHPKIVNLKELVKRVSMQDNNAMIIGETGTGKEIIAQSIHYDSSRSKEPFIVLNCAAVPENLIESTLFGTTRGAFTGSMEKAGLFEEADRGTLFLDEVNSMSHSMQSKLLRTLQEGTFRRVGSNREIQVDVRVISSCNEDVMDLLAKQKLRSDLFYRLTTIILEIPPLRDRKEDIPVLVRERIEQNKDKYVHPFTWVAPETLEQLAKYSWPGNVRELFHVVDYAMNLADDSLFLPQYLPEYCFRILRDEGKDNRLHCSGTLSEQMGIYEASIIESTLKLYGGNITQTARRLGIQRQGLQYRIRKYGILV